MKKNAKGQASKRHIVFSLSEDNRQETLSRDELRSRKKKKLALKRKIRRIFASLVLFAVVAVVGIVLAFTVFFKVDTITVKGDMVYPQKTILQKSGIKTGDNLFKINEKDLSEKLSKTLPYIESVTVERKLPDKLIITVKAARDSAAFVNNGTFVIINSKGTVLNSKASIVDDNIIIIEGAKIKSAKVGETVVMKNEDKMKVILSVLGSIEETGFEGITEMNVSDIGNVILTYQERINIYLGAAENCDHKLLRADAALEKENEINPDQQGTLDLRTDPYAYFSGGSMNLEDKRPEIFTEEAEVTEETTQAAGDENENDINVDEKYPEKADE